MKGREESTDVRSDDRPGVFEEKRAETIRAGACGGVHLFDSSMDFLRFKLSVQFS
jgi:hypothetical protein